VGLDWKELHKTTFPSTDSLVRDESLCPLFLDVIAPYVAVC